MEDKKKKFLYGILIINLALIAIFVLLFLVYGPILAATIFENEIALIAVTSRILILGIMSFFLYRKWLRQIVGKNQIFNNNRKLDANIVYWFRCNSCIR